MKSIPKKQISKANEEISEIDETLSLLRDNWLICDEHNKLKYQKLIDRALDDRLLCMATRDGKDPTPND